MKIKKVSLFLLIAFLAMFLLIASYGLTNVSKSVSSSGTIITVPGLGVYSDSACTQTLSSIAWGNITVGGTASYVFYIKNTGSANATLSMTTSSWSPSTASEYITVSWNQNGEVLTPGQVANTTLTLTVSPSTGTSVTTFSNDIVITGTG